MENIKEQFKKVIAYSQGIENPKVDEIFDTWVENKKRFIEEWGGLTKSLGHMRFALDANGKERMLAQFIDYCYDELGNSRLAQFVEHNKDSFFENKVVWDNQGKIPKGMKLLKAFKYFEEDPCYLHDAQTAASLIIQEDKVEGELILSVHPLDYLSLSENTYNWRSCHALDGEYCAGNLSYMMDKSTIICYLKGKDDTKLPRFPQDVPWNSKKWRVLLFFSEFNEVVFAGRQYPFSTSVGLNYVLSQLGEEYGEWHGGAYEDDFDDLFIMNKELSQVPISLNEWVGNMPLSCNFNDLTSSSCYRPVYAYRLDKFGKNGWPYFEIGHAVKCLACGEIHICEGEQRMACVHCHDKIAGNYTVCSRCGQIIYSDECSYHMYNGDVICWECADETEICPVCWQRHDRQDLVFDKRINNYICKPCYKWRKLHFHTTEVF